MKNLLRVDQAARELGVAVITLRGYLKKGKISAIRIGGLLRFKREEIDRVKNDGITLKYVRGREARAQNE